MRARRRACAAAARAGLDGVLDRAAGLLSHGEKRQLEIAMCLATEPQVLLLDEPLAGMGAEETERMLSLLDGLREGHAILLVEHDMDAVFRIADRITVLVDGAVIASGRPGRGARQSRRADRVPREARRERRSRPSSTRAASTRGTARATCCTAWTSHVGRGETVGLLGRNGMGKIDADPRDPRPRAPARGARHARGRRTSRARARTRSRAAAWPTCPKAAASFPTSRCARTW